MAKHAKTKKVLTPEEKLQQALVPVEEQPYPVPSNWCWTRISLIVNLFNGDRGTNYPSKKDYVDRGIPFINAGAIQKGKLDSSEYNYITKVKYDALRGGKIQLGDILYCLRGSLGKTAIVEFTTPGAISSSLCILRAKSGIAVKYLYCLLNSDIIERQQNIAENGSAQPNLSAASVLNYKIPVSPLPEQKRIIDRIEALFVKLDKVKEKAQAVVDGYECRKAAILHKAFTGELTAKWRKDNGRSFNDWYICTIGDVFKLQAGKNISAKDISSTKDDINCYSCFGGNGVRGYVSLYNNEGSHPIIGRQGALCGNINLASGKFYATEHAVVVSNVKNVDTQWAYYCLKFLNLNQYATATAQPGLAVSNIVKVPIKYAPFAEQQEISRVLDCLLQKEENIRSVAESVLNQIDTMKKSILARAFRGELRTNDPSDESAVELLKRVMQE